MTLYFQLMCPAVALLQMTGGHDLFRLYALVICDHCPQPRVIMRTLILCMQFPIVTTTLRGQLAGKTMTVLPRSLLLYCTAMVAYVNVKSQHICQAIPTVLRGFGEALVTNDWCIIYSL